jgi:chemotaxis protein histidine kinase CheA
MVKSASPKPAVTRYSDHAVIVPPDNLEKVIRRGASIVDDDPIARAEAALEKLSSEFSLWMATECDRLAKAWQKVPASARSRSDWDELFRAAHDIKGEAETFGFGHAGEVADSLCRLIENTPASRALPSTLAGQHVEAICAIIRERDAKHAELTASRLAVRLRQVTDEFLVHAAAEDIGTAASPPLVPAKQPER